MSQERDDEWLWDLYVHYIDMLAKLLEGYGKTNYFSCRFGPKMAFCIAGIWNLKVSQGSTVSLTPDFSPVITLYQCCSMP